VSADVRHRAEDGLLGALVTLVCSGELLDQMGHERAHREPTLGCDHLGPLDRFRIELHGEVLLAHSHNIARAVCLSPWQYSRFPGARAGVQRRP